MAKDKDDDLPVPSKKKGKSLSSGGGSTRGPSPQMAKIMLFTRIVGILLGGFVTVVGLMAVVGVVTDNFLARLLVGLLLAVGLPAFIADRILKRTNMGGGIKMVIDVFAIVLLAIALILVSSEFVTKPLFIREGDRYARSGSIVTARLVYFIGGVSPLFPADKAGGTNASPSGSAAPSASASGAKK